MPKSQYLKFATFDFVEGTKNEVRATPLSVDMERTLMSVKEAKLQADIVLVSIHSHQFKGNGKHNTSDFIRIFAHKCIDAWADIIVCHGPHVMRGIEQYNTGIIFHGLGDFFLELDTIKRVGEEDYLMAGTKSSECFGFGGLVKHRSKDGKIGLVADEDVWISYFVGVIL